MENYYDLSIVDTIIPIVVIYCCFGFFYLGAVLHHLIIQLTLLYVKFNLM